MPASFNFPHTAKLLSLSFVLFAAWFAGARCRRPQYPALAGTGVLVLFGSVNVAMPFLLDMFSIPADTFQLFLATSVVNARFGTLLSAMHMIAWRCSARAPSPACCVSTREGWCASPCRRC